MRRDTCSALPGWVACLVTVSACAGPATAPEDPSVYSNPYIEALAEALGERRLFEPRLTGGFAWAPCEPPAEVPSENGDESEDLIPSARCGELPEPGTVQRRRLLDVWTEIVQAVKEQGETAELLHARGVGHLLWSARADELELERAVDDLERIAELVPEESAQRVAVLSDLAAGYALRAGSTKQARFLVDALEVIEEAFALAPSSPLVVFNRAWLRSTWSLRATASDAWTAFLELDGNSDWAREARQREADLSSPTRPERWDELRLHLYPAIDEGDLDEIQQLVWELPLFSRGYAENVTLADWGRAFEEGRFQEADRHLALSRAIGQALAELNGDYMVADAVRRIDDSQLHSPTNLAHLARGHAQYGRGYRQERYGETGSKCESYDQSAASFEEGGGSFLQLARLSRVIWCEHFEDNQAADRSLSALRAQVSKDRYPALAGRIDWMLVLTRYRQGRIEEAHRLALSALESLHRARDVTSASAQSLLAETSLALGLPDDGWNFQFAALRSLAELGPSRGLQNALAVVLGALVDEKRVQSSRAVLQEMTLIVEELEQPEDLVYALAQPSRFATLLGDHQEAIDSLARARDRAASVQDDSLRQKIEADLDFSESLVLLKVDPGRAEATLDRALKHYERTGDLGALPELRLTRARLALAQGQVEAAEESFDNAFQELERRRRTPRSEQLRISFFDSFQDSIDEMIQFQLNHRNDFQRAFDFAEAAKSRALLERIAQWVPEAFSVGILEAGFPHPVSLTELEASLPKGLLAVQYALLADELVIWSSRREGTEVGRVPVSETEIESLVGGFRRSILDGLSQDVIQEKGAELYDLLIRPFASRLTEEDGLVLLPDKALFQLPFAALFDESRANYLIESHPLSLAPSASVLAATLNRTSSSPGGGEPKVLVVTGSERADNASAPLMALEEEARSIATLYTHADLLSGQRATPQRLLEALPHYDVVHVAAHAQLDSDVPLRSSLLLHSNGSEEEPARVYAHEIYGLNLKETELVVLAACSTGTPGAKRGREGVAGWARAFLAAGVPRVVGTLWEVEDQSTSSLMREFHRNLRQGLPTAQALQVAQVTALKRGPVMNWATPVVFGL